MYDRYTRDQYEHNLQQTASGYYKEYAFYNQWMEQKHPVYCLIEKD